MSPAKRVRAFCREPYFDLSVPHFHEKLRAWRQTGMQEPAEKPPPGSVQKPTFTPERQAGDPLAIEHL